MPYPKVGYDDYLREAEKHQLRFLHAPDQLPDRKEEPALWQCRITGQIFARSYANVLADEYPSPGQKFIHDYLPKFNERAAELGIEFLYDPATDYAPASVKDPCKWRGPNGNVVVASYYDLAYGYIKQALKDKLGISDALIQPR